MGATSRRKSATTWQMALVLRRPAASSRKKICCTTQLIGVPLQGTIPRPVLASRATLRPPWPRTKTSVWHTEHKDRLCTRQARKSTFTTRTRTAALLDASRRLDTSQSPSCPLALLAHSTTHPVPALQLRPTSTHQVQAQVRPCDTTRVRPRRWV